MENLYSSIFIVDISQNPDEVETVTSRIQQLIEDHGGIIKKVDHWGKRRLAYLIRKKSHGFYVEVEFTANSRLNIPRILEAEFRLNDRVLRYFTYVVSKTELLQRQANMKTRPKFEEPVGKPEVPEKSKQNHIARKEETIDFFEKKIPEKAELNEGSEENAGNQGPAGDSNLIDDSQKDGGNEQ